MTCMDCQTVNLAYAVCSDPSRQLKFRRYGSTNCEKFQHRIHEDVKHIIASITFNAEHQEQVVRA